MTIRDCNNIVTENNVGRKTPEEVKKWIDYCFGVNPCADCLYDKRDFPLCVRRLLGDALVGFQHIESRLAQVERERDALWHDMHKLQGALCAYCDNLFRDHSIGRMSCKVFGNEYGGEDGAPLMCGRFKWRGVCPENTKED